MARTARPRFWRRSGAREVPRRHRKPGAAVDTAVKLGPIELPNPIVAASGTFGHGAEVAGLCDPSRLGAVTAKSLAPYPWPGSPAPRLHLAAAGMLNAVGLQGPGVEHWIEHDLPALRASGARVIASVWGRTFEEFGTAAAMLRPAVGELIAVEVNVSCPNLEDRSTMFAHRPASTAGAIAAVVDADLGLPVFAKLSPNVTDIREIATAALGAGAIGLTLVNTVLGLLIDAGERRSVLGRDGGGLSGPAIKPVALRAVHEVAVENPNLPIIGTGGVTTGVDAIEMMIAGATAVGIGTATFHDPRAALRVLDDLVDWCGAHGVTRVADLTATLERRA